MSTTKNLADEMRRNNERRKMEIATVQDQLEVKRAEHKRLVGEHSEAAARGDDTTAKAIQVSVKTALKDIKSLEEELALAEETHEFTDAEMQEEALNERKERLVLIDKKWDVVRALKKQYLELVAELGDDFRDVHNFCRAHNIPGIGGSGMPEWGVFSVSDVEVSRAYGSKAWQG